MLILSNDTKMQTTLLKSNVNIKTQNMIDESHLAMESDKNNFTSDMMFKEHFLGINYENKVKSVDLQKTHPGLPFVCPECGKCFACKSRLHGHKMTHLINKPCKCSECGKEYKTNKDLRRHINNIHTKKQYQCKECPRAFNTEESLKKHIGVHEGYNCTECGYYAKNKYTYNQHIINVHKPEERRFSCTECDLKFSEAYKLKYHMKRHKGERHFICDVCGKQFVNLCNMQRHRWIHENKKPFQCTTCNKAFRSKFNLQIHMHSHTNEKFFFCAECKFGALTQGDLKIHMQSVHSNERPYECLACGNKYKTKGNLTKHQNGTRGTCHATVALTDMHHSVFHETNSNMVFATQ
ncbi:unnamed protein product, partial [Meganyctiphanes norvegica]|uniref:C2H2-type domain-containing protein n=1 Tax=Meganyctiphanes norvegica TaxID=48144 RepID=A0AAV2S9T9_MEGNR